MLDNGVTTLRTAANTLDNGVSTLHIAAIIEHTDAISGHLLSCRNYGCQDCQNKKREKPNSNSGPWECLLLPSTKQSAHSSKA